MSDLPTHLHGLGEEPLLARVVALAGSARVHLVGGAVRDRLLGRASHDVDLTVDRDGRALAAALARAGGGRLVALGGDRFAAWRVVFPPRVEGEPSDVLDVWDREGSSLEEDLARRDLTVNALAAELPGGELTDPFGGRADLAARRLRATTEHTLADDPLRVLRLARLAASLDGFAPERHTLELACQAAPALARVASERIRTEVETLAAAPGAARGFAVLGAVGIYPEQWVSRPARAGELARLDRLLQGFDRAAAALGGRLPAAPLGWAAARFTLAALALSPPPPPTECLRLLAERGWLSRDRNREAAHLLPAAEPPRGERARRWFLHLTAELWPTAVVTATTMAREVGSDWEEKELGALLELAAAEAEILRDPPRLVRGDEARELLGLPDGRALGRALDTLRRMQIEGQIRTRQEAQEWLRGQASPTSRSAAD
ncbi:MAG TPA: hypothetical protein VF017_13500 [Thermoanaerobaculia bacterium]|nr:hypothetical protein [Thermoanaerobaculia bacterium]